MTESSNVYQGYVKQTGRSPVKGFMRLQINPQVQCLDGGTKLNGFCLRISPRRDELGEEAPEMAIMLRPEEWLDLIDAMKAEFESAAEFRRSMDQSGSGEASES